MAMVKCPVCNGELSTEASTCPKCGHPQPGKQLGDKVGYVVGVLVIIGLLIGAWNFITTGEFRPKKKDNVPAKVTPIPR